MADAGRVLWAALHLADRQVVDCDDVPTAKVDDLEFDLSEEGDGLPVLSAILCGQAALARRFNRSLGRGVELLRRVIRPEAEPGPARIGWGAVKDIGTDITLSISRDDVDVTLVDRWLSREILDHIPGSGNEEGDR
jgi:hypothetical protein